MHNKHIYNQFRIYLLYKSSCGALVFALFCCQENPEAAAINGRLHSLREMLGPLFFKQNFLVTAPHLLLQAHCTHREALSLSPHLVTSLLLLLFLSVVHGQLIPLCWWLLRSRLNVTRLLTLQLHANKEQHSFCVKRSQTSEEITSQTNLRHSTKTDLN